MRMPPRSHRPAAAFTLVEMLVVITIILILVGLTVGVAGYANQKAARSRAEAEIKGLSAALENYKSDNGTYPRSTDTDALDARKAGSPSSTTYVKASKALYAFLTGQVDGQGVPKTSVDYPPPAPASGSKIYFDFKPSLLGGKDGSGKFPTGVSAINDPYGYSYGYSTAYAAALEASPATTPTVGYNPTFDLWCTAGKTSSSIDAATLDKTVRPQWLNNW